MRRWSSPSHQGHSPCCSVTSKTRLVSQLGVQYGEALSVQRSILREEFRRWHGREMGTAGDSFFVVFTTAGDAVRAALAAQRRLASYSRPGGAVVRVRMGLHTVEPTRYEDEYVGMELHRAARIASATHGGQLVVSAERAQVLSSRSPEVKLKDLGWHRLKDIHKPEHILQENSSTQGRCLSMRLRLINMAEPPAGRAEARNVSVGEIPMRIVGLELGILRAH
jgi:class 3 adenylate cyclase